MKYRKKPVVVEAIQWTGDNEDELRTFAGSRVSMAHGHLVPLDVQVLAHNSRYWQVVSAGDYIVRSARGELYPCEPDIFDEDYEAVDA